jgi:hypothetical protein
MVFRDHEQEQSAVRALPKLLQQQVHQDGGEYQLA